MELSDSLYPYVTVVSFAVYRADLAAIGKAGHRVSRVPHKMFPCMPEVSDPVRCVYALP